MNALALTYKSEPFCVVTQDPDTHQITGGMAFMPLKSLWVGKRLLSLPLTSYCDALANDQDVPIFAERAFANEPSFDSIELKLSHPVSHLGMSDRLTWQTYTAYVTNILPLDGPLDQLYASLHQSCIRRKIKKADKLGILMKEATDDSGLRAFYNLHTAVRKKHGLPPQPYRFFRNMLHQLKSDGVISIPVVEYGGQTVAAAIVLTDNNRCHLEYIACRQDCFTMGVNQALLWKIIKDAKASGAREVDFGRSSVENESLIRFKERWGANSHQLYYYRHASSPTSGATESSDPIRRRLLTALNKHLPSRLLIWEGEIIYRHLG